jgi:hypothetical protein
MKLRTILWTSLAVVSELHVANSQSRLPIDVAKLGPQVGEQVPDFRLQDQAGRIWTRESVLGPKGGLLVFVRSADW